MLTRESISDIAEVVPAKISFVNESIMQVGDLKGITNIGLESDREKYLSQGLAVEIIPKNKSYTNMGTIYDPGQRQAIIYNIYEKKINDIRNQRYAIIINQVKYYLVCFSLCFYFIIFIGWKCS